MAAKRHVELDDAAQDVEELDPLAVELRGRDRRLHQAAGVARDLAGHTEELAEIAHTLLEGRLELGDLDFLLLVLLLEGLRAGFRTRLAGLRVG